jgi:RimJ/RimL family protein N-acetyltransferase
VYNPYMVSKQIYLRHPTEEDVQGSWHEWFSDEEITKFMGDRSWPNSKEAQLEFYKSLIDSRDRLALSIVAKSNDKHIGVISLSGINWVHRYADIALAIGERECRKGPLAAEAFALMLRAAFLRLNLLNVKSSYCSSNINSEALHRLFKFKRVGKYENLLSIDGQFENVIIEILDRESWLKRNMRND